MNSVAQKYDEVYMLVIHEKNDGTVEERLDGFVYETYFFVFDKQVMATEMTDHITMTIYGVKDGITYKSKELFSGSVAELAVGKIREYEGKNDLKKCTAFADMLNFGAAVQRYMGETTDLADEYLGEYAKYATADMPALDYDNQIISNGERYEAFTVSMSMQSILEINLGFLYDLTSCEAHVTVDGQTTKYAIEPMEGYAGIYTIRIPIGATNVRTVYEICVKTADGEQVTPTYRCSAEGCTKDRMVTSSNESLKNMMVAMMKYGEAVIEAYPSA